MPPAVFLNFVYLFFNNFNFFLKDTKYTMQKIKVLVVPSDLVGGVGFYRSTQPHTYLSKAYPDEFDVVFNTTPDLVNADYFKKFDIVHIHKGLFKDMKQLYVLLECLKDSSTVMVMDIDDSWDLSPTHPAYYTQKYFHTDEIIKKNLSVFDYVTTTTPLFASEIAKFNKNVKVIPNSIDPDDPRFMINKTKSDFVRVGFVMGSAHEEDVKQMGNFVGTLPKSTLDKMQIVLCGFDIRGKVKQIDPATKAVTERPIQPRETTWFRYENMLTDNRRILSKKYDKFLNMFVPDFQYPDIENEHYVRYWTKDMSHYFKHYENLDVLYAPLEMKHFNYVKSQLKAIECCFSNTALIAQNFGPYTIDLTHALDENGNYNGGNALLVNVENNATDWVAYTDRIVNDKELLENLKKNIHETLKDKYCLANVTKGRAEFYKKIVEEKTNKI